ncbi:hypothetical protein [Microbacterium enclense]|uniref:hypothetical protein n=1 Tax=Microbacterium enclense TaxID=993073 RepID=UPI003F7FBC96
MELHNLRAVDHARAAQLAMAVNSGDDAMVAMVAADVADDERGDSALTLMLAQAVNLVQTLQAVIGTDATTALLQATLAQHASVRDQP